MLEHKLEQANKETRRNRLLAGSAIGVIVLVVGLSLVSLSLYQDNQRLKRSDDGVPAKDIASSQTPSPAKRPQDSKADISRPPVPTAPLPSPIRSEVSPPGEPSLPLKQVQPDNLGTPDKPDLEARDRYKDLLRSFEEKMEPSLLSHSFANWRPEQKKDIQFLKDASLADFAAGDFGGAVEKLENATAVAELALQEKRDAFDLAYRSASAAKDAYAYEEARDQIEQALRLEPTSEDAQEMADAIADLPEVIDALNQAKIARAENDYQREYDALSRVIALEPSRVEYKERARFLADEIKNARFAAHIKKGFSEVEKEDPTLAEASLEQARKFFPNREETAQLAARVKELKIRKQTEALLVNAKVAATSDDWENSLRLYEQAKTLQPDNQEAIQGSRAARHVVNLKGKIASYLSRPNRLASENVAKSARNLIEQASPIKEASPSLTQQSKELDGLLVAYAQKKPVTVISDEQTHIIVKGVGIVGTVSEKIVNLRPGSYTFEGKRKGYKSKLVRITISPQSEDLMVKLVCDERI